MLKTVVLLNIFVKTMTENIRLTHPLVLQMLLSNVAINGQQGEPQGLI